MTAQLCFLVSCMFCLLCCSLSGLLDCLVVCLLLCLLDEYRLCLSASSVRLQLRLRLSNVSLDLGSASSALRVLSIAARHQSQAQLISSSLDSLASLSWTQAQQLGQTQLDASSIGMPDSAGLCKGHDFAVSCKTAMPPRADTCDHATVHSPTGQQRTGCCPSGQCQKWPTARQILAHLNETRLTGRTSHAGKGSRRHRRTARRIQHIWLRRGPIRCPRLVPETATHEAPRVGDAGVIEKAGADVETQTARRAFRVAYLQTRNGQLGGRHSNAAAGAGVDRHASLQLSRLQRLLIPLRSGSCSQTSFAAECDSAHMVQSSASAASWQYCQRHT